MKIKHYLEERAVVIDNEIATNVVGRVVIGSKDDASNFFMRVFELKKGAHTPKHSHEWEHEIFVHSGKGEILCKGKWVGVGSGNVIFIPGGDEHQFRNLEEDLFTFICLVPSSAPEM